MIVRCADRSYGDETDSVLLWVVSFGLMPGALFAQLHPGTHQLQRTFVEGCSYAGHVGLAALSHTVLSCARAVRAPIDGQDMQPIDAK